jgi:ADP-dependent NAD(P)H-hydrate dehydratase
MAPWRRRGRDVARHPDTEVITAAALRDWALPQPGGHKQSRGQVIVVGGSASTPGAVLLSGLAALRVGAGVLELAVAASTAPAIAAAMPEAAVVALPELDGKQADDSLDSVVAGADAVLLGPGLDDPSATRRLLSRVVAAAEDDTMFVLDAFALGVLRDFDERDRLRDRTVLTPNTGEAERLLDADLDGLHGSDVAVRIAETYGAVVSVGGEVADADGRRWTIEGGHPGLGTSGSGDVLAGAVVGLAARGASLAQAACWGTYAHATAGDRLAARIGRLGFLARELADELPFVIVETEA